jgi:hypothetical protein
VLTAENRFEAEQSFAWKAQAVFIVASNIKQSYKTEAISGESELRDYFTLATGSVRNP